MSNQEAIQDSDIIDCLSVKYLKFFGIWKAIEDYRKTGKRNKVTKFNVVVPFFFVVPYFLCQCFSYFSVQVDLQKLTYLNMPTLPGIQLCCRVLLFWLRMEKQCRLYSLLRKDFLDIPETKRPMVENVLKKISKISDISCTVSMIVNLSIFILFVSKPGIPVDYILFHTGDMEAVTTGRKKILGGWYPLPMNESPYYEIIFLYEAAFMAWTGLYLPLYFCLFYQVLIFLYAQFTVLGIHIKTLNSNYNKNYSELKCDLRISTDEMRKILRDHQKLLRYTCEMKIIYNPLVTLTLGMGIIFFIINMLQFLIGKSNSTEFIFKLFQSFIFQGIEVSMFCFGSSFIETASSDLQFAIYSSDWYKADTKFRKDAQMMMLRAKKGETLTAVVMYPVNRETLMSFLQMTYTTSTVLTRLTEQD